MSIKFGTDSNIKVLNNVLIIIKSKYRVQFLNCIRRVARKFGELRPFDTLYIKSYILRRSVPNTWDGIHLTQNCPLAVYTFKTKSHTNGEGQIFKLSR